MTLEVEPVALIDPAPSLGDLQSIESCRLLFANTLVRRFPLPLRGREAMA
jgi:hypothetical protein